MKIALVADPHLISTDDPDEERQRRRAHFGRAWPSFRSMLQSINAQGVDLTVILGDLVDWYSPQNRDFALELLDELDAPWALTPGNHDFQVPGAADSDAAERAARRGWAGAGVELSNRVVDAGKVRLLLMDSAQSRVPDGTESWLARQLRRDERLFQLVCTHVPLDIPQVVDYILSVQEKNLNKYVQRGSPDLFEAALRGRVDAVFSGHLHFPGRVTVDGTVMEMRPMCINAVGKNYLRMGEAVILDTASPRSLRPLVADLS